MGRRFTRGLPYQYTIILSWKNLLLVQQYMILALNVVFFKKNIYDRMYFRKMYKSHVLPALAQLPRSTI